MNLNYLYNHIRNKKLESQKLLKLIKNPNSQYFLNIYKCEEYNRLNDELNSLLLDYKLYLLNLK